MAAQTVAFHKRFSLKVHLSTIFLILVTVICAVLGYLAYENTIRIIETLTKDIIARATAEAGSETEALFAPAETVVDLMATQENIDSLREVERLRTLPFLIRGLEESENIATVYVGNHQGDFLLVRRYKPGDPLLGGMSAPTGTAYVVQAIERNFGRVESPRFLFLRPDLSVIEARDVPNYGVYDPRIRPWYQLAREEGGVVKTSPYVFFTTREVGITSARPVAEAGVVVAADITLVSLSRALKRQKVTASSQSILLTQDGKVVAHPDPEKAIVQGEGDSLAQASVGTLDRPEIAEGFARFKAGEGTRFRINDGDRSWMVVFAPVPVQGTDNFILAISIPYAEIVAGANELLVEGGAIMLLLMAAAIGAVVYFAHLVTKPLEKLARRAEAVRRFEFDDHPEINTNIADIQQLVHAVEMMNETIQRFLEISSSVASAKDFDTLINRLIDEIVATTHTEAGILYLLNKEGTTLVPHAARRDKKRDLVFPVPDISLANQKSVVIRSIADAFAESAPASKEELEHVGLLDIASAMDDPPRHMLAAPLFNREEKLVGVLLLLETDELDAALVRFTEALSGVAAISLEARQLIRDQRALFDAFIKLIAGAIDEKSPYTGGHCERVPELTKMLAEAAHGAAQPPFDTFTLSDEDRRAIHVAAWLHDCGKVTTPEYVVDKATKLETIYDRIHEIRTRVEVLKRDAEIAYLKTALKEGETEEGRAALDRELAQLDADFAFIAECNLGGEFMTDQAKERLRQIGQRDWTRTLDDRLGLSHDELQRRDGVGQPLPASEKLLDNKPEHLFERPEKATIPENNRWGFRMDVPELLYNRGELYNLCISRGTLTREDRYKINEHIIQTIKMLDELPFPTPLRSVPEFAGGHHEKMDGTGYPKRLGKEDMSPVARMMAIADIFEALTAVDRPYKKGKTLTQALGIMSKMCQENHIDPEIYRLFLESGVYQAYAEMYLQPGQIDEVDISAFCPPQDAAAAANA